MQSVPVGTGKAFLTMAIDQALYISLETIFPWFDIPFPHLGNTQHACKVGNPCVAMYCTLPTWLLVPGPLCLFTTDVLRTYRFIFYSPRVDREHQNPDIALLCA